VRYVLIKQNSNYTTIILFLKTKLKVNKAHVPHSAHDSSDGQNQIFIRFRLNRFLNLIKYLIQALQDSTWDLTLIRFGNFSHSIQRTSDFAKKVALGIWA